MVLANRGQSFVPSVVHHIDDLPVGVSPPAHANDGGGLGGRGCRYGRRGALTAGTAAFIARGMDYQMAGKTGTSQVIGIAQDAVYDEETVSERNRNHGLFIAFAPVDKPRIVVAVIAENGGGSSAASPVARRVIDAWLASASDV